MIIIKDSLYKIRILLCSFHLWYIYCLHPFD